jgi:hypothetical protein
MVLRYRVGRRGRLSLGGFPSLLVADARKAARDAQREVALGKDPAREKQARAQALTFNELADLYLERHAKPKKRSWRQDDRQLRVLCRRKWGTSAAMEISRAQVRELLAFVNARRSGVISNRLCSCISKLFSWTVDEDS